MGEQRPLFDLAPSGDTLPDDLLALSFWQPWCYAVTHLGKPIDNRPRKPWARVIGARIALHASMGHGKAADFEKAREFIKMVAGVDVMKRPHWDEVCVRQRGAIVGVARVDRYVTASDDPWFFGPFGLCLSEVVSFDPVPCKGAQGFWTVPASVLPTVRDRWTAARAA